METLLSRIKTQVETSTIIQKTEIVSPRALPDLRHTVLPWVGIAPISTGEQWKTNARKEATHIVELYCCQYIQKLETAVIGDATLKGILDIVDEVNSKIRGETFTSYLSAPADITGIDYATAGYGDNYYLIVATITLLCRRIFAV